MSSKSMRMNDEGTTWELSKAEIGVLVDFTHNDKWSSREELEHVVFTKQSVMATDGRKLILVTQRSRVGNWKPKPETEGFAVHRDTLLRAKRAMMSTDRLLVPVTGEPISLVSRKTVKRFRKTEVKEQQEAVFTKPFSVEVGMAGYAWVGRVRGLSEDLATSKGRCAAVNPVYLEQGLKAVRTLGFDCVEAMMGKKDGDDGSVVTVDGKDKTHHLDVRVTIMGMRV